MTIKTFREEVGGGGGGGVLAQGFSLAGNKEPCCRQA